MGQFWQSLTQFSQYLQNNPITAIGSFIAAVVTIYLTIKWLMKKLSWLRNILRLQLPWRRTGIGKVGFSASRIMLILLVLAFLVFGEMLLVEGVRTKGPSVSFGSSVLTASPRATRTSRTAVSPMLALTVTPTVTPSPAPTLSPSPTPASAPTNVPTSPPTPNPTAAFAGTWYNVDPNTGNWVRIEITLQENTITAHFWGACKSTPCDAGSASTLFDGNPVQVSLYEDYGVEQITLFLTGEILQVTTYTHFTDNSGRSDFTTQDNFQQ